MARKVITTTTVTDDLDGSEGAETYTFGFQGTSYEIDLAPKNGDKLQKDLEKWIASARRVGRVTGKAGKRTSVGPDPTAVRAWAAANKVPVNPRGRISAAIIEQFNAAQ